MIHTHTYVCIHICVYIYTFLIFFSNIVYTRCWIRFPVLHSRTCCASSTFIQVMKPSHCICRVTRFVHSISADTRKLSKPVCVLHGFLPWWEGVGESENKTMEKGQWKTADNFCLPSTIFPRNSMKSLGTLRSPGLDTFISSVSKPQAILQRHWGPFRAPLSAKRPDGSSMQGVS